MPVYSFTFPGAVVGATVAVLDSDGDAVATGTLAAANTAGLIVHEETLAEGTYVAVVTVPTTSRVRPGPVPGVLDVIDSITEVSTTEPLDADINPGECFRWFDATNGAARVCFKGKTLDGTVVESSDVMT